MAEIKPAEISAILRKQKVLNLVLRQEVEQYCQVEMVLLVLRLSNVQYGELVEFDNGLEAIVLNLKKTMLVWYFRTINRNQRRIYCKKNTTYCFSKQESKW
jgi:F0F1-type ATP synthase alpha subunit